MLTNVQFQNIVLEADVVVSFSTMSGILCTFWQITIEQFPRKSSESRCIGIEAKISQHLLFGSIVFYRRPPAIRIIYRSWFSDGVSPEFQCSYKRAFRTVI